MSPRSMDLIFTTYMYIYISSSYVVSSVGQQCWTLMLIVLLYNPTLNKFLEVVVQLVVRAVAATPAVHFMQNTKYNNANLEHNYRSKYI